MSEESPSGITRLGKSGVGVILGGVLLAVSVAFVPFWVAALVVCLFGVGRLGFGTRLETTQRGLGMVAVGTIALIEATPGVGLGIEPLVLASIAIVFGALDIVIGALLDRIRRRE